MPLDCRAVALSSLALTSSDESLADLLSECGEVRLAKVIRDSGNVPTGRGVVVFDSHTAVEKAISLSGVRFVGAKVVIERWDRSRFGHEPNVPPKARVQPPLTSEAPPSQTAASQQQAAAAQKRQQPTKPSPHAPRSVAVSQPPHKQTRPTGTTSPTWTSATSPSKKQGKAAVAPPSTFASTSASKPPRPQTSSEVSGRHDADSSSSEDEQLLSERLPASSNALRRALVQPRPRPLPASPAPAAATCRESNAAAPSKATSHAQSSLSSAQKREVITLVELSLRRAKETRLNVHEEVHGWSVDVKVRAPPKQKSQANDNGAYASSASPRASAAQRSVDFYVQAIGATDRKAIYRSFKMLREVFGINEQTTRPLEQSAAPLEQAQKDGLPVAALVETSAPQAGAEHDGKGTSVAAVPAVTVDVAAAPPIAPTAAAPPVSMHPAAPSLADTEAAPASAVSIAPPRRGTIMLEESSDEDEEDEEDER